MLMQAIFLDAPITIYNFHQYKQVINARAKFRLTVIKAQSKLFGHS